MSEAGPVFFEASFNRSIKVRSRDERLTSDAGAILLREADHRLGLIESLAGRLYDPRDATMIRYTGTIHQGTEQNEKNPFQGLVFKAIVEGTT